MIKVITYGTYDLLHQGYINLLRRAKELGDYLIVGVKFEYPGLRLGRSNVQYKGVRWKDVKDKRNIYVVLIW